MLALAPLRLTDSDEVAHQKIRLVTTFADIYLARNMVYFRRLGWNTLYYAMFALAKSIRDMGVPQLRAYPSVKIA